MKEISIDIKLLEFDSVTDLPEGEQELLRLAGKLAADAYAPYSQFLVGAAILLEDGQIVTGSNQENVAYPSGMCAERVAIYAAGANHPGVPVKKIAIRAESKQFEVDSPVAPCGACRQAISEYEERFENEIELLLMGNTGKVWKIKGLRNLLPLSFVMNELKRD